MPLKMHSISAFGVLLIHAMFVFDLSKKTKNIVQTLGKYSEIKMKDNKYSKMSNINVCLKIYSCILSVVK